MSTIKLISLLIMVSLYCVAGVSHFIKPNVFLKITPIWVPYPKKVNIIIGSLEIMFGITLIFSVTRPYAAIAIIVFLIAAVPANIRHFKLAKRKGKFMTPTLLRIPAQALLIYWAYTFI